MNSLTSYDKIKVNHSDNIIINIKPKDKQNSEGELPGYYVEHSSSNITNSCELCWNCCHSFSNQALSIPLSFTGNIFHIHGYFCSFNCGARYIFDNYIDKNKWNLYSLLNLYYNISQNTRNKHIIPAPNKLILNKFGGNMDIEEYRKNNSIYEIYKPPILPVEHSIKKISENTKIDDNKKKFKLYRKSSINKNNIYNSMNLN
jgi:hypothetical protein